jgi:hypothetical protein
MQRTQTVLACVYGLFVMAMWCITYVGFYNFPLRPAIQVLINYVNILRTINNLVRQKTPPIGLSKIRWRVVHEN